MEVHISLSGKNHMRVSWITEIKTPSVVYYGTSPSNYTSIAKGSSNMYRYVKYKSGEIHNAVVGPLKRNTLYYYRCGTKSSFPEFTFKTPPSQFPIKFVVAGDLGQSKTTRSTLDHIAKSNYDILLLPGDVSYADLYQPRWDKFGALVQPLASKRPWMVVHGNHEIETIKGVHRYKFTAYNARWTMPYKESGSRSNSFYMFDVAGVHALMLGSYDDFRPGSAQFRWLLADLKKVNRKVTLWLVAVLHAPWYNSIDDHQKEYESVGMREAMEDVLFRAHVDIVFAGHVHAYERFVRVYKGRANECGPVYITSGASGNRESRGLARKFLVPQPKVSAFREANYGHGQFSIFNATLATWTWHRNNVSIASDKVLLRSLASTPTCNKA